jgi:thiamine biosynthesis lipoprotein ApbE/Na+-translocating ferredoxin:NAD+ oxidoreductase RnfG subunit
MFRQRSLVLRLFRAAAIVSLAGIVHREHAWVAAQRVGHVTLAQAQRFFPSAARIGPRDLERGGHFVFAADRSEPIGYVLTTAPETDDLIGYSGPSNVLVALDASGSVIGTELLASGDTDDHVRLVRADEKFAHALDGWKPSGAPPPRVDAVSGATLTSAAVAEGITRRLAGRAPSLRFPEPVTIEEVRDLFPSAVRTAPDRDRLRVLDASGATLGFAVRTAPWSDNVSGYRGPSESLVALRPDRRTVLALRLRKSFDTPDYVASVRADDFWMRKLFVGKTTDDLARIEWDKGGVEGVSGATETSYAMAEGLRRRFSATTAMAGARWMPRLRDWALAGVVAGACVMAFTHARGHQWARRAWQAVLIGYVGLASGDLLSLDLILGWAQHGAAWRAIPGLVLMLAATFAIPWASGRQIYCHQICPHGAAQQWLGAIRRKRRHVPAWLARPLEALPFALLAFCVVAAVRAWPLDLAEIEPFDAWAWRAAGVATISIAVAGLLASIFIPQAYCRYGCPTGALLRMLWSHGASDRFGRRDWFALALVAVAFLARPSLWPSSASEHAVFRGSAMGTTWMVKLERPASASLRADIGATLERIESVASSWRADSAVNRFNAAHTTDPQPVPSALGALVARAGRISRATNGALDITCAPLAKLWGFGPGATRGFRPSAEALKAARAHVGWEKVNFADGPNSLQKRDPAVRIDVTALTEGQAVDDVCALLDRRGLSRYLVEIGGELRARGEWQVAIEHPARIVALRDRALATSGTYRQHWRDGARERSHLIDPRTARPVEHSTVSVSVFAATCAEADAWATALCIAGYADGRRIAERENVDAQFVIEPGNRASAE